MKPILSEKQIDLTVKRLSHQIHENHLQLKDTVIIGLQPRGIFLADRIVNGLKQLVSDDNVLYGKLDITFYRDDVRKGIHVPNKTDIGFSIENKSVVIIDDVLYKGRTTRAALDALLDFGRPAKVELCVLIDRRFSREFPIQADYCGEAIDTFENQKVLVKWKENDGEDSVVVV